MRLRYGTTIGVGIWMGKGLIDLVKKIEGGVWQLYLGQQVWGRAWLKKNWDEFQQSCGARNFRSVCIRILAWQSTCSATDQNHKICKLLHILSYTSNAMRAGFSKPSSPSHLGVGRLGPVNTAIVPSLYDHHRVPRALGQGAISSKSTAPQGVPG